MAEEAVRDAQFKLLNGDVVCNSISVKKWFLKIGRWVPMMLKGSSFSRMLLIVLWSIEVCLATSRRGRGCASASTENYDEEAVQKLALSILEECEDGFSGIYKCMLDFVRSHSLKIWFEKLVERFEEWKNELEKSAETRKNWKHGYNPFGHVPTIAELNNYFKGAYDPCIDNFKEILRMLHGSMKSEDFFPDPEDSEEKMAERLTDLDGLRDVIKWRYKDNIEIYYNYASEALKVCSLAQEMRKDLLRCMKEDSRWESFVRLKKELHDSQDRFSREGFIRLVFHTKQEINALMLNYFAESDKERWQILIKSVRPVLKYKPLTSSGYTASFDGFDDLVLYFMEYVKERHAIDFRKGHEMLFERDLDFSRSLNRKMDLILLENVLNREGIRIAKVGKDDKPYN